MTTLNGTGPGQGPASEEHADELFDEVSGNLRDHEDTRATKEELRANLQRADEAFQRLHDWVVSGGPLPDPWRRYYVPRTDVEDK